MSKLSEFFGRKGGEPGNDKYPSQAAGKRATGDAESFAYENTSGAGSRMG